MRVMLKNRDDRLEDEDLNSIKVMKDSRLADYSKEGPSKVKGDTN